MSARSWRSNRGTLADGSPPPDSQAGGDGAQSQGLAEFDAALPEGRRSGRAAPGGDPFTTWQEREHDFLSAARCALQDRARDGWAEFIKDLMPWALIVNAGTFDAGALGYEVRRPSALRRIEGFYRKGRETLRRPLEGFGACEVGPNGYLDHWHGLLSLGCGLQQGDIAALSEVWRAIPGNGFIRLQIPRAAAWFAEYATKHTVKALGDVSFSVGCGRHWYEDWS